MTMSMKEHAQQIPYSIKLLWWKTLTNFGEWRAIRQSFPFQSFPC